MIDAEADAKGAVSRRSSPTVVSDLRPIAPLRRFVDAVRAARPPAPEGRAWFLAGVQRYEAACLADGAVSLEQALGLGRRGQHAWWNTEARDQRNRLLLDLRARHFAHLGNMEAAGAIASLAARASARAGRPAPGPADSPSAMMAAVLATGQGMPGPRHLRRILAAGLLTPRPKSPSSGG
ncbi:MAG: hypothetical protein ACRYG8_46085 [Janthinobacterium lividum]